MRITHQMLSRNYVNRMNTNLTNLTKSNEQMSSQRAFNKGYENVADAGKALRMRKLIEDNERYQTTVRDAKGRAAAAEDALRTVNSLMINAKDKVVAGLTGTYAQDDLDKMATELEKAQEEVLLVMNTQFSEKYVFAASGNADGSAPFQVKGGVLEYNGTVVSTMTREIHSNKVMDANGHPLKYNADNFVDIGFGYKLQADGTVDPNSAFKDSYSGVQSFGSGQVDGSPVNAYDLLGDMVDNLRTGNMDGLNKNLGAISTTMNALLTSITEIGARGVTLENTMSTLENEYINLADAQKEIEGLDIAEESIYNKNFEMSWMVTLQLGSKILPTSIFDFLR